MPKISEQLPTVKDQTLDIVDDVNEDWFNGQGATERDKQIAIRLRQNAESLDGDPEEEQEAPDADAELDAQIHGIKCIEITISKLSLGK